MRRYLIYKSAFFYIFTFIITLVIALRLALPYALLSYAEYKINQIPEYKVTIDDVDVALFRGSYTLKNIDLRKITKNIPVPFFSAKAVDFSIQWRPLLHGSLVGKIFLDRPKLNFVLDPKGSNEQVSIDKQWQTAVSALYPLNFNQVKTENGELTLQSFTAAPPFKLALKNVNFSLTNLYNGDRSSAALPSYVQIQADSLQGGSLTLDGKFNPFAKQPTFDLESSLVAMPIKEAKNLLKHYTAIEVQAGTFNLFIELVAAKGKINGYAKPIVKNLKVFDSTAVDNPIEALYQGAVEIAAKILTNPQKKTIATKINLRGNINDPDKSILSIIGYLLRNAFIQALLPQVDHTIEMRDVIYPVTKKT